MLGVAAVFGLIGAAAMTVGVPARRKLAAIAVGVAFGITLPLVIFWGLAAALPKNEGTVGYFLFGYVYAVPSGLAGAVAGSWRGDGKV